MAKTQVPPLGGGDPPSNTYITLLSAKYPQIDWIPLCAPTMAIKGGYPPLQGGVPPLAKGPYTICQNSIRSKRTLYYLSKIV
jgi:hypothetical protein